MTERVMVEIHQGVADVRMNRPDKLNALDPEMFEALANTGARLAGDRSVRCVVLSGEGRAFCAGLDFAGFAAQGGDGPRRLLGHDARFIGNHAQRVAWVWQDVPVPVIAAIHGYAFGGGLQIALGADLRYVSPEAQLSVMEIRWGLVPDMSGTQSLRHLVRLDVAKELTFTGRKVSGTEAVALGLATSVHEAPHRAAMESARQIAEQSPHAIRAAKRLLNESRLGSIEEGLLKEERAQRGLLGSPNQLEAVAANFEKRVPRFDDVE